MSVQATGSSVPEWKATAEAIGPCGGERGRRTAARRSRADRAVPLARVSPLPGRGGQVYLWNVISGQVAGTYTIPGRTTVYAVTFTPGRGGPAAACGNGWVYLWDMASRVLAGAFAGSDSRGVNGVAFAPAGDLLAAADGNGCIYLWRMSPPAT